MLDWIALLPVCAPLVHVETMSRVVAHESKGRQFAIGVNGDWTLNRQPQNLAEALATAAALNNAGIAFDVGLGQLSSGNIRKLGLTFEQAFDPCRNLQETSKILHDNYVRASRKFSTKGEAYTAALSAYNTGNFKAGISNGYVAKVLSVGGVPTSAASGTQGAIRIVPKVASSTPKKPVAKPARFAASDDYSADRARYDGWSQ